MKARGIRNIAKVGLFAFVIAIAGLAVALDGRPASASHTKIITSRAGSNGSCPSPPVLVTTAVGMLSGPPVTLCVWAKDVDDPEGVGAFELGFTYNSNLVTVLSVDPQTVWLGSTGRSVFCSGVSIYPNPETGNGVASVGCSTINIPPPFGPGCTKSGCPSPAQSTGLIGKVTVQPGSTAGLTTLDFASRSFLVDTGRVNGSTVISPARIPNSVMNVNFRTSRCADFTGDRLVRGADITYVVQKYGTADALADLDESGGVRSADITIAVLQFGLACPT